MNIKKEFEGEEENEPKYAQKEGETQRNKEIKYHNA